MFYAGFCIRTFFSLWSINVNRVFPLFFLSFCAPFNLFPNESNPFIFILFLSHLCTHLLPLPFPDHNPSDLLFLLDPASGLACLFFICMCVAFISVSGFLCGQFLWSHPHYPHIFYLKSQQQQLRSSHSPEQQQSQPQPPQPQQAHAGGYTMEPTPTHQVPPLQHPISAAASDTKQGRTPKCLTQLQTAAQNIPRLIILSIYSGLKSISPQLLQTSADATVNKNCTQKVLKELWHNGNHFSHCVTMFLRQLFFIFLICSVDPVQKLKFKHPQNVMQLL